MTTALRQTGIEPVGEMPWGTHFCLFYETRDDLLETLLLSLAKTRSRRSNPRNARSAPPIMAATEVPT